MYVVTISMCDPKLRYHDKIKEIHSVAYAVTKETSAQGSRRCKTAGLAVSTQESEILPSDCKDIIIEILGRGPHLKYDNWRGI